MPLPIVERHPPHPETRDMDRVDALANRLTGEDAFAADEPFLPLLATEWPLGAELQIDDQSDIDSPRTHDDTSYLQDRARLRASDGDLVVCNLPPADGYESYCEHYLALGKVAWHSPGAQRYRRHLASHAWRARAVRRSLVKAIRSEGLRTIHPLIGSREVWQLASLLRRTSRRALSVLAPPPALSRWVNDKNTFAATVRELFGESAIPRTFDATSLALASRHVRDIALDYPQVGLKLPNAAGGAGNIVIPSRRLRGRSLDDVAGHLRELLRGVGWTSGARLLVSAWESEVVGTPSAQIWIPPDKGKPPVVEGIFEQFLSSGWEFVGTRPAELPADIAEVIATRSWLLASLYQRLGYRGRCSFDFILAGKTLEDCQPELIECNGRWGGASFPMTLVHRLFGANPKAYVVHSVSIRGLARASFASILENVEPVLYDARSGGGDIVLFDPARIHARSSASFIAIGRDRDDARSRAVDFTRRLREIARWRIARTKVGIP